MLERLINSVNMVNCQEGVMNKTPTGQALYTIYAKFFTAPVRVVVAERLLELALLDAVFVSLVILYSLRW